MSHRLQILIPESLDASVAKAAQRAQRSKGAWVRWAIEQALSIDAKAGDPVRALSELDAPTGDIETMLREIDAGRQ